MADQDDELLFGQPVPFSTDDAILAFALENAGFPRYRTPTNRFTKDSLTRLYKGRGLTLIEALRDAWKKVTRGDVRYWFDKTPQNTAELSYLLAAYKDQVSIIEDPDRDRDGGELAREIMAKAAGRDPKTNEAVSPMDEREALLRLTCVIGKGRVVFMNLWKTHPPRLLIPLDGKPEIVGPNRTRHPGFNEISADTTDEKLREMGLI
jgi:hypothetical protein